MTYKPENFRGELQDGIVIDDLFGEELFDFIKEIVMHFTKERGIPAEITEAEVKSGGLFNGTRVPMIVIHHPDPTCKYFDIGIVVNNNMLDFPLLGSSAENYKYNMHESLTKQGNIIKAAFYKPDIYKIQQEQYWEQQIAGCINMAFTTND